MKERFENIIKLIPTFTILCYVTGFIVYNTHLSMYGIVDLNFFNLRYITAGILYLFLAALIITPIYSSLIANQKYKKKRIWSLLFSLLFSSVMFTFYAGFLYDNSAEYAYSTQYSSVIFMSLLAYLLIELLVNNNLDWADTPTYIFVLGLGSMILFGMTFKNIKTTVGGGKPYKNILIVENDLKNIIKVDSLNQTDTLTILHENEDYIYFLNDKVIQCIKEKYVKSKIIIK